MFNNDRVPKKTWKNGRGDLGLSPKFSDKPIYIHWFHTVNPSIPEHLISKELSNKPSCLVVAYRLFSSRFVWKSGTPKSMVDHRFEITNISGKTTIFSQTQVHISLVQYGWIPCLLIKPPLKTDPCVNQLCHKFVDACTRFDWSLEKIARSNPPRSSSPSDFVGLPRVLAYDIGIWICYSYNLVNIYILLLGS